jgi:hypothetical protein
VGNNVFDVDAPAGEIWRGMALMEMTLRVTDSRGSELELGRGRRSWQLSSLDMGETDRDSQNLMEGGIVWVGEERLGNEVGEMVGRMETEFRLKNDGNRR